MGDIMKLAKIIVAAALLAASGLPLAGAQAAVFTGTFSGANEAPGNVSSGTGEAVVTIDELAQTMLVEIDFSGLTGVTTVAHLHCCTAPGASAPVAVSPGTFPGFPVGVTSGSYAFLFDLTQDATYTASFLILAGGTAADASALLIASLASGLVYANIHTSVFPGGEIRANLSPETAVPLPAAAWLFLAGGAFLVRATAGRRGRSA